MHIKQVIIRGFKTYKDQTSLDEDFSPGTNVVVGFNGSGKSNFFQAILFVLSDQYSSLRAETRKALLHEGAGQAVLTAYVEVILDNSDRRIPIESDQVSIRRLIGVKKDDWLLDGRHATKAEVFGLLEGAGFAKTSPYYIVQQGKVSELCMMTDTQRLGLLKDISGAGVYDDRRSESIKIMEDTTSRGARCDDLIVEIETKLKSLEGEQRELRECERLESRRRTLEYVLADREWRGAQERAAELEARRAEAATQLNGIQSQIASLRHRGSDTEAEIQKLGQAERLVADRHAALQAARDKQFEALAKARLEADDGAQRSLEAEDQGASRLATLQLARTELAAAETELAAERLKVEAVETRARDLEQRSQVASAQREQLVAKQGRKQQYKTLDERNKALDEEIQRRVVKIRDGKRGLEEAATKLAKTEERGAQAAAETAAHRKELDGAEHSLGELGKSMRALGERLERGSEEVRLMHQLRSRAARDLEQSRRDAVTTQYRLEGTLPRAQRQGLTAVMRWAEEQGLTDKIRGPLLQFIEVPAAFRAAVEAFAGSQLFNVLATDDEVAAQAVKLVRTKRLGAVVVTPLAQLKKMREQAYPQIEGVKPLVDVIKCPDWARPAVMQIFGKAVACRTMELCEEVARSHGFDTITLDGDRVSRRGVVTGGYQDPGRFVRLALAEQGRAAEGKIREAESQLPGLEARIQGAAEALDTLHAERRSKQEERERVRAAMQHLTEKVQGAEATATRATRSAEDLKEWKHRMVMLVSECQASAEAKKLERASKTLGGLTPGEIETLASLTSQLDENGGAQEAAQRERRMLRTALEEREASVESCMRKRLHDLEGDASRGNQDDALERAEVAAQTRTRLEKEHRESSDAVDVAIREIQDLAEVSAKRKQAKEEATAEEEQLQEQAAQVNMRVDQLSADLTTQSEKKAEVDARLRTLVAPMAEVEERRQVPKAQLVRDLADANRELMAFSHVNRKAMEQFENFSEQLLDLRRRKEEIDLGESSLREALQQIDEQKDATMLQTLRRVNEHFQQAFAEMVPGGMGKLQIIRRSAGASGTPADSGEGTEEPSGGTGDLLGVRIEVSFTGQSRSFLAMGQLSGGQKTVVALSLIFAIQRLEPAPFYLLDEVDAALDASYRSALANLIATTAQTSQVVYTTFRPEVLDKADRCYRVYQQNRASRIDAVTREQAKQVLLEQDRLAQVSAPAAPAPLMG